MNVKSANGVECCLIYCADDQYRIRVYKKDAQHSFVDYDIATSDLFFTINDEDAYFYESDSGSVKRAWIDHSSQTLGLQQDTSVESE